NVPPGTRARLVPPRVDLTVQGPQKLLASYALPDGSVWVDAGGLDPGSHRVTPQIDLPDSLEVTRRDPEVQTLEIVANHGPTPRSWRAPVCSAPRASAAPPTSSR